MTVDNSFQIVSIDSVYTMFSYNLYSIILNILNTILKNRVYKTLFIRYLYDDLHYTF